MSAAARVSDSSGHMGDKRVPLPAIVAVRVPVGLTVRLPTPATLDPGSGDSGAGGWPAAGPLSGGRNLKHLINHSSGGVVSVLETCEDVAVISQAALSVFS